jgi:peptidoglycan hydrolase-like protein with peptidoglycan-binding domain
MRYAVENNQPIPPFLTQSGHYDAATQNAVTQFQEDFAVVGATPKIYGQTTRAALENLIQQWNIGEYQYWMGTTQSLQNRIQQVALPDHLAGVAIWRAPFETNGYWSMLTGTAPVNPTGQ